MTSNLYFSNLLPYKQPVFFKRLENLLLNNKIDFNLIPNTKDIWARDFMPVQIKGNKYVQFDYNPDYLQSKRYKETISDVDLICESMGISTLKSNLKLDGGNIIKLNNKVIICDKVITENPTWTKTQIIDELIKNLEVDQVIFIPWDKTDFTGHADGMIRFINNNTVLVNNYSKEPTVFKSSILKVLKAVNLDYIELPYNPYGNRSDMNAKGIYINYLQYNNFIIAPIYGLKEDEKALKILETVFKTHKILPIMSNELAKEGGVLNCISWTLN